ncbi:LacI family DNA-binding transcriptional regulator [Glaciecola sp. 1036]|uniref:LacI family DNA-binding transcriptional regulator n=1 Tax=Alteromonadaceae TaxID=72275 RepID=UPI003D073634
MSANKLTIKQVANELGVSTATISNAFNRPDQLSAKKRESILAACNDLGYFGPNKAARSLRQGKSNIIALILPDELDYMVSDPVASEFIEGVAKTLKTTEKHLLLFSGSNDSLNEIIDFVDGFICYGSPRNACLLKQLSHLNKKIVTVDFDIEKAPSINIDNKEAAYQSACIALEKDNAVPVILGLRLIAENKICTIKDKSLIEHESSIAHRRLDGYLKALKERHISIGYDRIWHIPENTYRNASLAAKQALSLQPRPNVVLCMSDVIAMSVMKEALSLGIRIPDELRVIGFDGIEQGQRFHPTLTTVQQFSVEKGQKAAEMFIANSHKNEVLGFKILRGESAPKLV